MRYKSRNYLPYQHTYLRYKLQRMIGRRMYNDCYHSDSFPLPHSSQSEWSPKLKTKAGLEWPALKQRWNFKPK